MSTDTDLHPARWWHPLGEGRIAAPAAGPWPGGSGSRPATKSSTP